CSSAAAYIKPVLDRENLTVQTRAHVTEIRFDGDRAVGVTYEQDGVEHTPDVTGEIVLSAGAFNSPQLLMLPGVGPADHLEEHGIDVRVDLPGVGQNLQDHLFSFVVYDRPDEVPPAPTSTIDEAGGSMHADEFEPPAHRQSPLTPISCMEHARATSSRWADAVCSRRTSTN
ncbi:GMC family oxidoreductase N-terminal domain-containing protein, partial [Halorubrum lacusprofundi]|uniref:GMC family oxidoreductase N-terminal domain-containing protein n=1 Tax=Halorubrum lacusprofundi TaxID=2247 RepID=UPI0015572A4B